MICGLCPLKGQLASSSYPVERQWTTTCNLKCWWTNLNFICLFMVAMHTCGTVLIVTGKKIVCSFLKKKKVKSLDWASNRPDLSPIENLCISKYLCILHGNHLVFLQFKDKVAVEQRTTTKYLRNAIKQVWIGVITAAYCTILVHSMRRRLQAVIKK